MADIKVADINRSIAEMPIDTVSLAEERYHARVTEIAEYINRHDRQRKPTPPQLITAWLMPLLITLPVSE